MVVVSSGAAAHLYLNLEGRDAGGVVKRSAAGELLARAAKVVADLRLDDEPVVEEIVRREELAEIELDHPASGDLVVFLAPGFAASGGLTGEVISASRYYGQHGFRADHDSMCGMLFARGGVIEKGRTDELPATAVAPMIANLLGFSLQEREPLPVAVAVAVAVSVAVAVAVTPSPRDSFHCAPNPSAPAPKRPERAYHLKSLFGKPSRARTRSVNNVSGGTFAWLPAYREQSSRPEADRR